eukprot:scaffold204802_cov17-Tisochrysis_lutea.AAC.1
MAKMDRERKCMGRGKRFTGDPVETSGRSCKQFDVTYFVLSSGSCISEGVSAAGNPGNRLVVAESVWAAQALVLFENLREDLQGGLDTVETLEAELNHLLLQGGANAVSKEAAFLLFFLVLLPKCAQVHGRVYRRKTRWVEQMLSPKRLCSR